jgi:hypothetical protein
MCNECNRAEEEQMIQNEKDWIQLKKHITEADKIFMKVFGIYLRVDPQYHTDLIVGFGANIQRSKDHDTCPDFDYSAGVLYINNVW